MAARLALVTGATGFIGSQLVPALFAQGWPIRASGRRPRPGGIPADVDYRAVDLAGDSDLVELCDGVTHVFHLAGASSSLSDEDEMHRSNVVATERLLAALDRRCVQRVLYMSSTSVYGEEKQLPTPVPEDVEPSPSRGYGKAKWATEQLLWAAAADWLPVVVVRPVSVFGPGNIKLLGSAVLDVAIERYAGRRELPVHSRPVEQRLAHIDDLIRACLHLVATEASLGRAFNVVYPAYPTSHEVAAILADELGMEPSLSDDSDCGFSYGQRASVRDAMLADGMKPDIILTKERFRFMRKENRNNRLSVDALIGTGFGFDHTGLETGIRRTVGWYRDNRWIMPPAKVP